MSDVERLFHEAWLGMVQPIEGLVVSIPVLVDAQCMERLTPQVQEKVRALCTVSKADEGEGERFTIANLGEFLTQVLGLTPDVFDTAERLPAELELYVHEGRQTLRPTMALRKQSDVVAIPESPDVTPAMRAGAGYEMLVWDLPEGLDLDKPETQTGPWDYPPSAKFDRLLRQCRVSIGLLTNREVMRLIYAPHGESSGAITFSVDAMVSVGGRPILDAFVMLLSANRFLGVAELRTLPAILAESRKRQANVTNDLADQVFEALHVLLRGFETAAERDGRDLLDDALARGGDHLYKGLLTVLLRLVFLLYAEDRGLLPIEDDVYTENLSVLGLFEQLQADHGAYPDSMSGRFGSWGRLVTLFRAVFLGAEHGTLKMPPRRGSLFNPHEYPFLEGWGPAGSAPITQPEDRARVKVPTIDDDTVFRVLEKLLVFEGQRLSYRALDVEQIGSVYEALMGYHVVQLRDDAASLRLNSKPGAARAWVEVHDVLAQDPGTRAAWLRHELGFDNSHAAQVASSLGSLGSEDHDRALEALLNVATGRLTDSLRFRASRDQFVLQPGAERRRTSSHYTPRSFSAPIVRRTLEPLLAVMGAMPAAERILNLTVCDPAMGSGAFLVEACRFLADHVLAAWTREGNAASIAATHGAPLLHARRLVAQRCLYGVDKNDAAVELAKLSLWLVTLSKDLPFTFLDHSLRHGDSLVGLDFEQIRSFHWKPAAKEAPRQLELFDREIAVALDEAVTLRQRIGALGDSPVDDGEKARLFWDAQDALDRVRLIGDLVVGAFFEHENENDREVARAKRETLVRTWLTSGGPAPDELLVMQREIHARVPVFHWMPEFPEVFYAGRPDPLDDDQTNRAAFMDAFVGNPPFLGGKDIGRLIEPTYSSWLSARYDTTKNADLCAHFFRRANDLLGLHGTMGLIATDKIAQGETRTAGLQPLVQFGLRIYWAESSVEWPGPAGVTVAIIHLAKGNLVRATPAPRLDNRIVQHISSQLEARLEVKDPLPLSSNAGFSHQGVILYPDGFIINELQRETLILQDSANTPRIRPYLGGDELNMGMSFEKGGVSIADRRLEGWVSERRDQKGRSWSSWERDAASSCTA